MAAYPLPGLGRVAPTIPVETNEYTPTKDEATSLPLNIVANPFTGTAVLHNV